MSQVTPETCRRRVILSPSADQKRELERLAADSGVTVAALALRMLERALADAVRRRDRLAPLYRAVDGAP